MRCRPRVRPAEIAQTCECMCRRRSKDVPADLANGDSGPGLPNSGTRHKAGRSPGSTYWSRRIRARDGPIKISSRANKTIMPCSENAGDDHERIRLVLQLAQQDFPLKLTRLS